MTIIDKIIKENKLIEKPKEKYKTIIKNYNEPIIERDERGNTIHYKDSDGDEYWCDYDSNNNKIYHKNSDGYEYWKKYDSNNNVIHYKDSDDDEYWYEYDSNNNEIHYKDSWGQEYWKEYDENNNITKRLELRHGVYYLNGKELKKEE